MTDWDEILENIHRAMQAVDEAHSASEQLRQDTNHDSFRLFVEKMQLLQEHQRQLLQVLGNEEAYAIDELVDALSMVFQGHKAEYRRTPRMRG